ncbi:hypothetical protein JCM10450v2_001652 [Rhodotorula kratochvilovae]
MVLLRPILLPIVQPALPCAAAPPMPATPAESVAPAAEARAQSGSSSKTMKSVISVEETRQQVIRIAAVLRGRARTHRAEGATAVVEAVVVRGGRGEEVEVEVEGKGEVEVVEEVKVVEVVESRDFKPDLGKAHVHRNTIGTWRR